MPKQKQIKVRQPHGRTLLAILSVLLIAFVGSYFVFSSKAAQEVNKHSDCQLYRRCRLGTDWFSDKITQIAANKVRADMIVDVKAPAFPPEYVAGKRIYMFYFYQLNWYSPGQFDYGRSLINIRGQCVDITRFRGQENAKVYSATATIPSDPANRLGSQYDMWFYTSDAPNCAELQRRGIVNAKALSQPGSNVFGHDIIDGYNGDGGGTGDKGNGDNGNGNGDKGTGPGGGGSGGSSANQQNEKSNNIPSTSNQGTNKQPTLEPSPFYDGKQYTAGSVSDVAFGGLFARDGQPGAVTAGRLAVAGLLVFAIAGEAISGGESTIRYNPIMPGQKKKVVTKSWSVQQLTLAAFFVVIFAGIGTYMLLQSKAETTHTSQYEEGTGEVTTWITGDQPTVQRGQTVTSSFSIGIRNTSTRTKYVTIGVDIPRNRTSGGGTVSVSGVSWNTSILDVYSSTQAGKSCYPVSGATRNMTLVSYNVTATASGGTDAQSYASGRITIEYFASCGGTSLGRSNKHVNSYWGPGDSGGGCMSDCGGDPTPDPDPDPNPDPDGDDGGDGPGDQGKGTDPGKNTNSGGGSGGSSATKSGGKNTLPTSSPQGSKKQTELEPSPFYDGKEYKPGSDAGGVFGELFTRNGQAGVVTGGRLAVAALLLLGIAGGGYWWWRKRIKRG